MLIADYRIELRRLYYCTIVLILSFVLLFNHTIDMDNMSVISVLSGFCRHIKLKFVCTSAIFNEEMGAQFLLECGIDSAVTATT